MVHRRLQTFQQLSFLPNARLDHGGETNIGKRKQARPFDPKRAIHLVLRSSRARGEWSFLSPSHSRKTERLIQFLADKNDIRIYRFANVGNHLHLLLRAKVRRSFQTFLRNLAGAIASLVTGAKKSNPIGKFWDHLAYTRIVSWGREFKGLQAYLVKNLFEAAGLLNRNKKSELEVITFFNEGIT